MQNTYKPIEKLYEFPPKIMKIQNNKRDRKNIYPLHFEVGMLCLFVKIEFTVNSNHIPFEYFTLKVIVIYQSNGAYSSKFCMVSQVTD